MSWVMTPGLLYMPGFPAQEHHLHSSAWLPELATQPLRTLISLACDLGGARGRLLLTASHIDNQGTQTGRNAHTATVAFLALLGDMGGGAFCDETSCIPRASLMLLSKVTASCLGET